MSQPKRKGRPVEKPLAEPIPDTPQNIARAVLGTPPKKRDEWSYLKKGRQLNKGTTTKR